MEVYAGPFPANRAKQDGLPVTVPWSCAKAFAPMAPYRRMTTGRERGFDFLLFPGAGMVEHFDQRPGRRRVRRPNKTAERTRASATPRITRL